MGKTYETAPAEVGQRAKRLIEKHHADLEEARVKIDFLFARSTRGAAVSLHGYQCLAVVRIVNLKDRAKKNADAEITIDEKAWDGLPDIQKDALLDHELEHLIVARDKHGNIKTDDLYRPKLKMRKHDWDFGWFEAIARRYGNDAMEVKHARTLWDNAGQAFFPFLNEMVSISSAADVRETGRKASRKKKAA